MFTSVVFTNDSAYRKAMKASNAIAAHDPFKMIIFNNLVQSTLDVRYVKYIAEAVNEFSGPTGLVVLTCNTGKYYDALDYLSKNKIAVRERFEGTGIIIVEIPTMGNFTKFYDQLAATMLFDDVEADFTGKINCSDITCDTCIDYPNYVYNQHGWLPAIQAAESLAVFNSIQSEMHVAIMDTKVDITNADLVGRTANDFDCVTNTPGVPYTQDVYYVNDIPNYVWQKHGTPMAGIVAANSTNGILVQSHTRNKVKAQVLRVLYPVFVPGGPVPVDEWEAGNDGTLYYGTSITIIIRAFNKAMENPRCAAISISWEEDLITPVMGSAAVQNIIDIATTTARNCKGIPVFAAAGNNNTITESYPAILNNVICVGGTSGNTIGTSIKAPFSNYGISWVSAPAVNVLTTDATGTRGYTIIQPNQNGSLDVVYFNGTSASAPIVAGIAAIMVLVNPQLRVTDIEKILKDTAEQVGGYTYTDGYSEELGYGLVNMFNAVTEASTFDFDETAVDYTVSITTPEATVFAGSTVTIPWTVDIDPGYYFPLYGGCPTPANLPKLTFYRSTSPNFTTSSAVPIGFVTLAPAVAATTVTGLFTTTIPCGTTGDIYIYAIVDSNNIISESDESNNMDSGVISVAGSVPACLSTDLSVTVVSTQIAANGLRRMVIRFTNTGQTNINTWNFSHGWIGNTGSPATVSITYPTGAFLAPGATRNVSLFAIQSPQGLPNTFYAQINTVNGSADDALTNNYSSLVVTA